MVDKGGAVKVERELARGEELREKGPSREAEFSAWSPFSCESRYARHVYAHSCAFACTSCVRLSV